MADFFWKVVVGSIVILVAARVAVSLERVQGLGTATRWTILVLVAIATAFLLSALSRYTF